jgi:CRISPR-associated protein Cas2
MDEQPLLVLYDIQIDRIRTRISDTCLDYGLERVQYSAFQGKLSRNKREELWLRLKATLEEHPGKILLQPICEKDFKVARSVENAAVEDEASVATPSVSQPRGGDT